MDNDALELVTVLEVSDPFARGLATFALEDAGIDYVVSGDETRFLLSTCSSQIQVAGEDEAAARELLGALANPDPAAPGQ